MTEAEAKQRWCPFARRPQVARAQQPDERNTKLVVAANRGTSDQMITRCLGSACMAWRWDDVPNPEYRSHHRHFMAVYPPDPPPMYLKSETDGFCGLAGKP